MRERDREREHKRLECMSMVSMVVDTSAVRMLLVAAAAAAAAVFFFCILISSFRVLPHGELLHTSAITK